MNEWNEMNDWNENEMTYILFYVITTQIWYYKISKKCFKEKKSNAK